MIHFDVLWQTYSLEWTFFYFSSPLITSWNLFSILYFERHMCCSFMSLLITKINIQFFFHSLLSLSTPKRHSAIVRRRSVLDLSYFTYFFFTFAIASTWNFWSLSFFIPVTYSTSTKVKFSVPLFFTVTLNFAKKIIVKRNYFVSLSMITRHWIITKIEVFSINKSRPWMNFGKYNILVTSKQKKKEKSSAVFVNYSISTSCFSLIRKFQEDFTRTNPYGLGVIALLRGGSQWAKCE